MELSNVQEIIERSIFEKIRLELVVNGYLPDITNFPDTPEGVVEYNTAVSSVIALKGFVVDVFGGGSNYSKGVKKVPRIVIKSGNFLEGDIGSDTTVKFEKGVENMYKLVTPPQIVNYYFEVHLISNSLEQERLLNAVISNALSRRKYIKVYNDPSTTFFVRYLNFFDADDNDQGLVEKVFSYEVPDCYEGDFITLTNTISPINSIDLNINLRNYYGGDLTETLKVENT